MNKNLNYSRILKIFLYTLLKGGREGGGSKKGCNSYLLHG